MDKVFYALTQAAGTVLGTSRTLTLKPAQQGHHIGTTICPF